MDCPACRADNAPAATACFACGAALDPALAGLASGSLFAARFEILSPLGRGGMGMVYRAFDRELGEAVAIKVLRPDVARESGRVERRFRSEIRLARRVRHRNVCPVYGDGEDRGLLYICMELVEGENLAGAARRGGGLPPAEAWSAALQVAEGLRAIHEVGIVHRDLKTANLMRDRRGLVRVMDFGIAKLHEATTGSATVTASGTLMGTPEYMSPEQLRGEEVGFRSDLYSLAVVVFELFTGAVPFRGDTQVATIVRQLQDRPFLDLPKLPPALRPVLARALAKDPDERYADAEEMRRALAAAAGSSGLEAAATRGAGPEGTDLVDDTRDVAAAFRDRPPLLEIAAAQAAVAALAVHLFAAGGSAPLPGPPPISRPSRGLSASSSGPSASSSRPAFSPLPLPAGSPAALPDASPVAAPSARPRAPRFTPPTSPARAAAPSGSRVYEESEVDVRPRRVAGTSVPYPEWGPRLGKGERVSITASFVVTEEGLVTDIRVESGGGVLEAVLPEISRWRYEPGRKGGVPVKVRVRTKHTFIGG